MTGKIVEINKRLMEEPSLLTRKASTPLTDNVNQCTMPLTILFSPGRPNSPGVTALLLSFSHLFSQKKYLIWKTTNGEQPYCLLAS